MQEQSHQASDDRPVDANVLQVFADFPLDGLHHLSRRPFPDRVGHQLPDLVAVPGGECLDQTLHPIMQHGAQCGIFLQRAPDIGQGGIEIGPNVGGILAQIIEHPLLEPMP